MDSRTLAEELRRQISGEVRFDKYSKVLYSTDASIYQIEPLGVVIPKNNEDVIATIRTAARYSVPVLPRGGGTSLAGQAVGPAIILDFSKYMYRVLEVNPEEGWIRAEPGISLDELNHHLRPHSLKFAPDPATSNRATVGGALGNNSCGSHSILFGKTVDNVKEISVVLPDGDEALFKPLTQEELEAKLRGEGAESQLYRRVLDIVEQHRQEITLRYPKIMRRVSGYNLDEFTKGEDLNLAKLIVGSEGTLATITEAKLHLVPRPKMTAMAVLHFKEIPEAMEAAVEILHDGPSAVELVDRPILEMSRSSVGFARSMAFIEGDPAALLLVEFIGDSEEELKSKLDRLEQHMQRARLGYSTQRLLDMSDQANVWSVRQAGLGLLMGIKGDTKPLPFVEDTAVAPEKLPDYIRRFDQIVREHDTAASYYGHASVGCMHIRPMINLKLQEGLDRMVSIATQVSDLVLEFGGAMSGEHGDGIVRGVWNEKMFGTTLYNAFREVKAAFDPHGIMNPGKIIDCPPMTENLRYGPKYRTLAFETRMDFSMDGGFAGAVELCNGMGACRKTLEGTMCPSYVVTREEEHSTRGRANALRAVLSGVLPPEEMTGKRLYDVLDLCLECKACKAECPSNVDMAKLKHEFLNHYYKAQGLPLRNRLLGNIATLNSLGCFLAPFSTWAINSWLGKEILDRFFSIDQRRLLPPFAEQTFEQWFRTRSDGNSSAAVKGKVLLFPDTFTNYNYPLVGQAATKILERLGYQVLLPQGRCCGRPMISKGMLEKAKGNARHNVELLYEYVKQNVKVVVLEPSCVSAMRDDYLDLLPGDEKAKVVAQNTYLMDEFLQMLYGRDELALEFKKIARQVLFHGHCHQKSLMGTAPSIQVLRLIPGLQVEEIDSGCCGMAGSFGYEKEHYDISLAIGEGRLFPAIRSQRGEFDVVASGISCRQQIEHSTGNRPKHLVEILVEAVGGK